MTASSFNLGAFRIDPEVNRLTKNDQVIEIEPQVMDLLVLFSRHPGEVLPKAEIAAAIWGGQAVNDDALTRTLWKLRQALGDDAKAPRFIETVPKRGYRLIASVARGDGGTARQASRQDAPGVARMPVELTVVGGVLLVAIIALFALPLFRGAPAPEPLLQTGSVERELMLQRADAFYAQYTRAENEAALRLYETVLAGHRDDARALAGVANALVQRTLRFEGPDGQVANRTTLTQALESGWLDSEEARPSLERARAFAEQATQADPGDARAWRALGLALSTLHEFDAAEIAYNRALVIEPYEWGALVNLSEITQDRARAIAYLEQAYEAMTVRFAEDAVLVRDWQFRIGLSIAQQRLDAGDHVGAERWYRRVLSDYPLEPYAVRGLADLLRNGGDTLGADALCEDLLRRTGQACERATDP